MGIVRKLINWVAEEVQKSTGEADRREKVSKLKDLAIEFKQKVSEAINCLNEYIQDFNQAIHKLNSLRNITLKSRWSNGCYQKK